MVSSPSTSRRLLETEFRGVDVSEGQRAASLDRWILPRTRPLVKLVSARLPVATVRFAVGVESMMSCLVLLLTSRLFSTDDASSMTRCFPLSN